MKTYGIDINLLTRPNRTGVERYVFELISEMMEQPLLQAERVTLYSSEIIEDLPKLPTNWRHKILKWPLGKGWTHGRLSLELLMFPPDIFFTPGHEIPLLHCKARMVTTIHDIAFLARPDLYPKEENKRQLWAVKRAVKTAAHILTPSKQTADDMSRYKELLSVEMLPPMSVTPLAAAGFELTTDGKKSLRKSKKTTLQKLKLKKNKYVLFVGRIEKKKNVEMIAEAFLDADFADSSMKLVLVGKKGFGAEEVEVMAKKSKGAILMPGFVDDASLAELRKNALAFVFPSHYEGFGLPILEAMEAGLPTVVSDLPVHHEVGGEAAIYCDPINPKSWIFAIRNLMDQPSFRKEVIEEGKRQAVEFTWKRCAEQTWKALRSVNIKVRR